MSCNPTWTVHCDGGGPRCEGWTAQEDSKSQSRKTARARGWLTGYRNGSGIMLDYCPPCRRERGI